nr:hypothetical protein [Actinomyces sp.]
MAPRFNPPPNWPAPPEGFIPPPGWQPDPAWGPLPEGWQLWVDDEVSLDPTSVIQPVDTSAGSAPSVASAPSYSGETTAFPAAAPTLPGAPGDPAAPSAPAFAAPAGPVGPAGPTAGGWQPVDVAAPGGGKDPLTRKWWFWLIIVLVVLAVVGGTVGAVLALVKGSGTDSAGHASSEVSVSAPAAETDSEDASGPDAEADRSQAPRAAKGPGSSMDNPVDPSQTVTFKAGQFDDDPQASMDVTLGAVEWNANDSIKAAFDALGYSEGYKDPGAGKVYMRVPVTVTYHGSGQLNSFELSMDYVKDGNTHTAEPVFLDDEFDVQDMPRDGGSVTGYYTYVINASDTNSGVFAASAFSSRYDGTGEVYIQAK